MSPHPSSIHSPLLGTLSVTSVIGAGSFGAVYAVESNSGSYAVKRLFIGTPSVSHQPPTHSPNNFHNNPSQKQTFLPSSLQSILAEVAIMKRLNSTHSSLNIHDTIFSNSHVDIVMDLCQTDLLSILSHPPHSSGISDPVLARELIIQLIDAVRSCHARGVFHRDLKPENILISEKDLCLKLCDFGLATTSRFSTEYGCGTARYMAPEVARPKQALPTHISPKSPQIVSPYIKPEEFDPHMRRDSGFDEPEPAAYDCALDDAWAVGILILNILTSKNPWGVADPSTDQNYNAYINGHPDALANSFNLTPQTAAIVCGLLNPNPSKRWRLSQAKKAFKSIRQFIKNGPILPESILNEQLLSPTSPSHPSPSRHLAPPSHPTHVRRPSNPEMSIDNIIDHYSEPQFNL